MNANIILAIISVAAVVSPVAVAALNNHHIDKVEREKNNYQLEKERFSYLRKVHDDQVDDFTSFIASANNYVLTWNEQNREELNSLAPRVQMSLADKDDRKLIYSVVKAINRVEINDESIHRIKIAAASWRSSAVEEVDKLNEASIRLAANINQQITPDFPKPIK